MNEPLKKHSFCEKTTLSGGKLEIRFVVHDWRQQQSIEEERACTKNGLKKKTKNVQSQTPRCMQDRQPLRCDKNFATDCISCEHCPVSAPSLHRRSYLAYSASLSTEQKAILYSTIKKNGCGGREEGGGESEKNGRHPHQVLSTGIWPSGDCPLPRKSFALDGNRVWQEIHPKASILGGLSKLLRIAPRRRSIHFGRWTDGTASQIEL